MNQTNEILRIQFYLTFIRKSVEEAGRSVDKTHRRLTNQLNKKETVNEEEEENSNDSNENDKLEQNLRQQRRAQRHSE